ncbi:acetate kinase [Streptococcus urinalis FB127-CNA-2]|uniref:Acetate kinase n=1 Tax=Streptococcus urinalis 2285-97 TaxID=764291 RepID=G5KES9_9STRE|nr:acetate kinase [Streptococcus urinalis]EHJ57662.1 acetate kinase [Streptococcus urinalis 2285-97]EKS18195.1 acetate kinase [Streptococcus urinalis FB127-CNA-2]VEF32980.1 acetate kinase [Streptococcus urinalis]
MSKTIAINAGSSSLKWQLYKMPEEEVIAKGLIERIGLKDSISTVKFDGKSESQTLDIDDHHKAVEILMSDLLRFEIIKSFDEITGVGHRVVAGGEDFKESTLIGDKEIEKIDELSALAPLHNPAHVAGIKAFKEILPDITSVAVFDTAFHTTMPAVAYRYPIANKYYEDYQVRKYGAHGTSHQYVSQEAAKLLDKPAKDLKIITCHIGNGASITAVKGGKSVDTSMGLTPLGGIMMGTRSGDLDPAIIPFLIDREPELSDAEAIRHIFNRESGLLGISERSSDMRDIIDAREAGDEKAKLAFDMYVDRVQKYIGQYVAVLNGVDAIVFTAGVGENSVPFREAVIEGLTWFGMSLDPERNVFGAEGIISTEDSSVKVMVIPTDEELVIARDVERLKNK